MSEKLAANRRRNIPDERNLPAITRGIRVRLQRVLDLTDPKVRRALGVTLADLRSDEWDAPRIRRDEVLTQAIGRAAFEAGFEGMLVLSAVDRGGWNLVVFPQNMVRGSRLEIADSSA